jgi:hypothetical protein
MKKILAIFSVFAALVFTACSVGNQTVASGMPDEGYIIFVADEERAVTADIDGTTYQLETIKEKKWRKNRDVKATAKGKISVSPGQHEVKVTENGKEIYSKKLFISASETKVVNL